MRAAGNRRRRMAARPLAIALLALWTIPWPAGNGETAGEEEDWLLTEGWTSEAALSDPEEDLLEWEDPEETVPGGQAEELPDDDDQAEDLPGDGGAAETPAPGPTVAPPERIILLKSGASGEEVRILQARLKELGYYDGEPDGQYGPGTKAAVQAFQKRNGLSVDGMAGPQTQDRLYSAGALGTPPPPEEQDVMAGEWPLLVNKEHPVGEGFLPAGLVRMTDLCDPDLVKIKYPDTRAVRPAVEALITMLEAAKAEGVTKWQISAAFRSYEDQEGMLEHSIRSHMKKNEGWSRSRARRAALRTVAEPGASEHHTGLCFDINVPGASSFSSTKQCKWLHAHCWEYGFIVRYQKGKEAITGFSPEAWHIRYVGAEHALVMRDENLCLEEYLDKYAQQ